MRARLFRERLFHNEALSTPPSQQFFLLLLHLFAPALYVVSKLWKQWIAEISNFQYLSLILNKGNVYLNVYMFPHERFYPLFCRSAIK